MSLLEHQITSSVAHGDMVRWECQCGTWGTCLPELAEQIKAEHLAADDSVGPMGTHAANVLGQQAQQ